MKGVGERVTKFSKETAAFAAETGKQFTKKGKEFSGDVAQTARRSSRSFGDVIALLVKIFVYFIVGVILFAVITALFSLGVVMIGLLPLKNYILNNGWQTVFAWGTLLFIWVPVISLVTSLIRRLAKMKGNSQALRISFLSLWLLGLACVIGLLVSVANDFRYRSTANEQSIVLSNAKTDKLELHSARMGSYYRRFNWLHMEPFANFDDEDTVYVNNLHVRIIKSASDSFEVKLLKMSDGPSRQQANELSSHIEYNIEQKDSILSLSKGIAITEDQKFRNQQVYVTIAVPIGKRILIDGSVANWDGNVHIGISDDDWRYRDGWQDDNDDYDWDHNVEYTMTKEGLKRTDGRAKNNDNNDDNENDNNDKLEKYNRQREELEKERDQKQNELKQLDSALKKPLDTLQPEQPKTSAIKTAVIIHTPTSISHILLSKLAI